MIRTVFAAAGLTCSYVFLAAGGAAAEQVEISLADKLDGNLSEYCIDIAGGNENVDPANGLQAHTCYSYRGDLGTDQVFDADYFTQNTLFMPIYDVCATAAEVAVGGELSLATCDGSDAQSFIFSGAGTISPASDTALCFTAAEDTRMGRGGTSAHQIKGLTLETCSDDLSARQIWIARTEG